MDRKKHWASLLASHDLHDMADVCRRLQLACPNAIHEASVLSWAHRLSLQHLAGEFPRSDVHWKVYPSERPLTVDLHVQGQNEIWAHHVASPCNAASIASVFDRQKTQAPCLSHWLNVLPPERRHDLFRYIAEDVNEAGRCFNNAQKIKHSSRVAEAFRDAIREGNLQATIDALAIGVPKRLRDADGNSPLHWAARFGHQGVAQALMLAGFSAARTNDAGQRPVDVARVHGHHHLSAVLATPEAHTSPTVVRERGRLEPSL